MELWNWVVLKCSSPPPPPQGPYFAPLYEPLPEDVQFIYDGVPMKLSEKAEEAAGFFAKMLDHEYTKKDIFCQNFFQDWRKVGRVRFNNDVIRNNLWGAMCKLGTLHAPPKASQVHSVHENSNPISQSPQRT